MMTLKAAQLALLMLCGHPHEAVCTPTYEATLRVLIRECSMQATDEDADRCAELMWAYRRTDLIEKEAARPAVVRGSR